MKREERVNVRVKESTRKKLQRMSIKRDTTMLLLVEEIVSKAFEEMKGGQDGN